MVAEYLQIFWQNFLIWRPLTTINFNLVIENIGLTPHFLVFTTYFQLQNSIVDHPFSMTKFII